MKGIPKAAARSAAAARASPSHHRAATGASSHWPAIAAHPSPRAAAHSRASIPRARAGRPASSSAISRVDAADTPAVASVTNREYTASTSWYRPIPSPPRALAR